MAVTDAERLQMRQLMCMVVEHPSDLRGLADLKVLAKETERVLGLMDPPGEPEMREFLGEAKWDG